MRGHAVFRFVALFLSATLLMAADDPWTKVQALKNRDELRIYRNGAKEPLVATMDEANSERILIVVKNKQISIPKEEIDRVDARTVVKEPRKLVKESTVQHTEPDYTPHPPGYGATVPGDSVSNSVGFSSSKPGFETVYRRPKS